MKTRITPGAAIGSTLIAALLFGACSDTPEPTIPPNGEKEKFPCEGPWCFDPESNPMAKDVFDFYKNIWDDWVFDVYAESYAACRYEEKDSGVVVVTCPDWLEPGIARCPQNWFKLMLVPGEVRAPELGPNGRYCFPETEKQEAIQGRFFCANGYVNPGQAASDFDARLRGEAHDAHCLRPEDCATLEELRWPSKEKSCFYSDFSHISEGAPEPVDCATLAEGECSINCACPEQPVENQHLLRSSCNYLSPHQAVGVCSYRACSQDSNCNIPELIEGQCIRRTDLPDWAQRYADGLSAEAELPVSWGACVEAEHFANWRNNDKPGYQYGDE